MGRARKPLADQTGNLTRDMQKKRSVEEEMIKSSRENFLTPPDWLINETAAAEYRRLSAELIKNDLVSDFEINALGNYCNAFARCVEITKRLVEESLTVINNQGNPVENPLINLQLKYSKEMRDNGRLCGLTIDSRLKFASQKLDKFEEEITEKFGDI